MNLGYLCPGKRVRMVNSDLSILCVHEVINDLGNRTCEVEILILRVLAENDFFFKKRKDQL